MAAPARTRRRRTLAIAASAALVFASTGAGAVMWVNNRSDEPIAGVTPEGAAGLRESPTLASAPWLYQGNGAAHIMSVRRLPAIEFPPGTTYPVALNCLLRSVVETGTLPRSARPVASTPFGVVWQTGTKRRGPRLDLTAPWGFTVPGGRVRVPTFSVAPPVSPAEGVAIFRAFMRGTPLGTGRAKGLRADVPKLVPCQIRNPTARHRACVVTPPRAKRR